MGSRKLQPAERILTHLTTPKALDCSLMSWSERTQQSYRLWISGVGAELGLFPVRKLDRNELVKLKSHLVKNLGSEKRVRFKIFEGVKLDSVKRFSTTSYRQKVRIFEFFPKTALGVVEKCLRVRQGLLLLYHRASRCRHRLERPEAESCRLVSHASAPAPPRSIGSLFGPTCQF